MTALLLTLAIFPLAGFATMLLLRLPAPNGTIARFAFAYLLGLGAQGMFLYLVAASGIRLHVLVFALLPIAAIPLIVLARRRLRTLGERNESHVVAGLLFSLPLAAFVAAATVMPVRDYDGRITWLPKARAIAIEESVTGPFFHGERGLNLHNRYPLLMPLDAASVMKLAGDTRNEAARWIYVLLPIAALIVMRAMVIRWFGSHGAWIAAAIPWLPVLTMIEGGALAAYNDLALAAFAGVAVPYVVASREDGGALRVAGLFAAFAVMSKNDGSALAVAIVLAAILGRRVASFRQAIALIAPLAVAQTVVVYVRSLVPPAYDEQYEVLVKTLPQSLGRVFDALPAIARHAAGFTQWGVFWIAVAVAAIVALLRTRAAHVVVPLLTMLFALGAYVVALTVTSWSIRDLAPVVVDRLLMHLLIPATIVVCAAVSPRLARDPDQVA